MLIITKGYLIKREDYGDFDEIITFINEHGIKFVCFSAGSKKINSKNSRNLNIADYLEFEIFYSQNKLSRLKKVSIINSIDEHLKLSWSLTLINEYYYKIDIDNINFYYLYQKVIYYILKNTNDYILILFILINIYKLLGLDINLRRCYKCGNSKKIKSIFLEKNSSVCKNCFDKKINKEISIKELKIFSLINDDKKIDILFFDDYKVTEIKKIITEIIIFIYRNSGIYVDCLKWF